MPRPLGLVATAVLLAHVAAAQNLGEAAIRERARRQALRSAHPTAPPEAPRPCPSPAPGLNAVPRIFRAPSPGPAPAYQPEGTVELSALIGTDGSIREVQQARSSGDAGLDARGRALVMKRTYCPALEDGKPVQTWYPIRIWFAPVGTPPEAPRPPSL
jgi:TonB family protein